MSITLIHPAPDEGWADMRLRGVLNRCLAGKDCREIRSADELEGLAGQRLLFALPLGDWGVNLEYQRLLVRLRSRPGLLAGCTAGLIVDGRSELYTKSAAAELALAANLAGCAFVGRPLVEGTGSLANLQVQADLLGCTLNGAYAAAAAELAERLESFQFSKKEKPELLVLHASSRHVSNTLDLWSAAAEQLGDDFTITELGLRNGTLSDCSGCPYSMCLHFGEKGGCFYGGVMQEEVYPAVRRADALVMACPNYNDALSANLTAFINRLTALFRQTRFYDKALFAIVVSGYSGGDVVARQLISAMNMNKSFYLPQNFALIETANNPGEALALPGIEERLDAFVRNLRSTLLQEKESLPL